MISDERFSLDLDLFGQMKEVAEKQREALLKNRLDEFALHCSRRQSIQKAISANRTGPSTTGVAGTRKGGSPPHEISMIFQVIESIQAVDQEIERLISLKREALMDQMKEIRHGQKALRSYGNPHRDLGGRFLQTRG